MDKIGKFHTAPGDEFHGTVVTLTVQHNDVRIVPVRRGVSVKSHTLPTHRVYAGEDELGAGWKKPSERGFFIDLKIDDPSFAAPIYPRLATDEAGDWVLFWERSK